MVITNELIYVLLGSLIFFSALNFIMEEAIGTRFGLSITIILSLLGMIFSNIFILMLAVMIGIGAISSFFVKLILNVFTL
jgi:hypothetical protein